MCLQSWRRNKVIPGKSIGRASAPKPCDPPLNPAPRTNSKQIGRVVYPAASRFTLTSLGQFEFLTYSDLTRRNGTRTGNSDGDGGRAGACGRGGEFAWRVFCCAQGLAAAIPAIFFGAGRGVHAGGGVPRNYSRVHHVSRARRAVVCAGGIFPHTPF